MRDLAADSFGPQPGVAVVAVGGYGRGALSPHSDVDLWLLVPPRSEVAEGALRKLLHPVWDAGFRVGHGLGSPQDFQGRASRDLHAATSWLHARLLAGDEDLFQELLDRRRRWLDEGGKRLCRRILESTAERHRRVDRAGWALSPDLKDDIGGLRDLHTAAWLAAVIGTSEPRALTDAGELLLAVREALHAEVRRKTDRMQLELQPRIAERLGLEGDDAVDRLMTEIHSAARKIEHGGTRWARVAAERLLGGPKRSGESRSLDHGLRIEDGLLVLPPAADDDGRGRLEAAVKLLAALAETGRPPARSSLEWLDTRFSGPPPERWSDELRSAFRRLLRGPHAPGALELLDHAGGWTTLLPEWGRIRGRALHDPHHRYTVDGHSFLTVAEVSRAVTITGTAEGPAAGPGEIAAATAAREAGDLDTLYLAALLHDVGKGSGEDHRIAGERLARAACVRIGLNPDELEEVAHLVRWHLLLADTATRRDLDDGAVISEVAGIVEEPRRLHLLYILTLADARATGSEAWSEWKAALVQELYGKALEALGTKGTPGRAPLSARAGEAEAHDPRLTGRAEALLRTLPGSYLESSSIEEVAEDLLLLMEPPGFGEVRIRIDGLESGRAALGLCVPDRPGALARTAGVLALNRVSILRAKVYSTTSGLALERFALLPSPESSWKRVSDDLRAAYSGKLALEARLERKARHYLPKRPAAPDVRILQEASPHSTIIEVRAPDSLGLLYAVASGLTDLDIDIHVAKIDTLGGRVVDVFYVRTLGGRKLNSEQAAEVSLAVTHRLERMLDKA